MNQKASRGDHSNTIVRPGARSVEITLTHQSLQNDTELFEISEGFTEFNFLTAHLAGPTFESNTARVRNAFDNVQRVARGEAPLWVVPELLD